MYTFPNYLNSHQWFSKWLGKLDITFSWKLPYLFIIWCRDYIVFQKGTGACLPCSLRERLQMVAIHCGSFLRNICSQYLY